MTQLLPLNRSNRLKNQSIIAIILAVLLHVLVAIMLYFTVFHDASTPDTLPLDTSSSVDKRPLPASIITEGEQVSSHDIKIVTANINKQKTEALSPDNVDKQSAQLTENTKISTAKAKNHSTKEPVPLATANNNTATEIKPSGAEPSDQPEYKLKKTQEYEQLDDDIDKDSEQLSKLIDEVKKRNQSQIQQHQLSKTNTPPIDNLPNVQHDYPITTLPAVTDNKDNVQTDQ